MYTNHNKVKSYTMNVYFKYNYRVLTAINKFRKLSQNNIMLTTFSFRSINKWDLFIQGD